jgi:outer membrane protein TolC
MQVFGAALNQEKFDFGLITDVPDADNLNVHGLVLFPLYRGGQITASNREARSRTEAAKDSREAVDHSLAFAIAKTFFTIQKNRSFLQATQASIEAFEGSLGIANKRLAVGTALKTEVLDVEVRLAEARENHVRARNAEALSLQILGNLLALDEPPTEFNFETVQLVIPDPQTPPNRPELRAAEQEVAAATAALAAARGERFPTVNAFARYDYDHGWYFNGGGDSYTAGVELQWNLWDGHRTRGRIKEATAALESSQEQQRKLQLAVQLEVAQARLSLQEANERLEVTTASTTQAAESAELTRSRFEQGLALSTQLIDAETALTAARVRRAEAEADHRIAIAALRRALGLTQLPDPTTDPLP